MLEAHAKLALSCQVPNAIVPNNGSVIRLAPNSPQTIDHVETSVLALEPGRLIDSAHPAISERRKLQYSGTIHASLVLNKRLDLLADPKISTVGLIDENTDDGLDFEDDLIAEIEDGLRDLKQDKRKGEEHIAEEIRILLRRYTFEVLRIKPKTDVHVTII